MGPPSCEEARAGLPASPGPLTYPLLAEQTRARQEPSPAAQHRSSVRGPGLGRAPEVGHQEPLSHRETPGCQAADV